MVDEGGAQKKAKNLSKEDGRALLNHVKSQGSGSKIDQDGFYDDQVMPEGLCKDHGKN